MSTPDAEAVRLARAVLARDRTVDAVATRLLRDIDPMCPSLADKGDDAGMYRDEARKALVHVLTEGGAE